jgi:hypothetical protein
MGKIIFSTFPKTVVPKKIALTVVEIFKNHFDIISTVNRVKGLNSDEVLDVIKEDLQKEGFEVEKGKNQHEKIYRPVFFGENAKPTVQYEIDAFHDHWKCGVEVEAGRAWMGNAVYRDLIQSLVMVDLEHLIIAVPQSYKYKSKGKDLISKDYEKTRNLIETLYNHSRFRLPYDLTLIGY